MRSSLAFGFLVLLLCTACGGPQPATQSLSSSSSVASSRSERPVSLYTDRRAIIGLMQDSSPELTGKGMIVGRDGLVIADASALELADNRTVGFIKSVLFDDKGVRQSCDSFLQVVSVDPALRLALLSPIAPLTSDCRIKDDFVTPWNAFASVDIAEPTTLPKVGSFLQLVGFESNRLRTQRTLSGRVMSVYGTGAHAGCFQVAVSSGSSFFVAGAFTDDGRLAGLPVGLQVMTGSVLMVDLLPQRDLRTWIRLVQDKLRSSDAVTTESGVTSNE